MSSFLINTIGRFNAQGYTDELLELQDASTINEAKVDFLVKEAIQKGSSRILESSVAELSPAEHNMFTSKVKAITQLRENPSFVYSQQRTGGTTLTNNYHPDYTDAEYRALFDNYDKLSNKMYEYDQKNLGGSGDGWEYFNNLTSQLQTEKNIEAKLVQRESEIHQEWVYGEGATNQLQGFKKGGLPGAIADVARLAVFPFYMLADLVENVKYIGEREYDEETDLDVWHTAGLTPDPLEESPKWQAWKTEWNENQESINNTVNLISETFSPTIGNEVEQLVNIQTSIDNKGLVHYKYLDDALNNAEEYGLEFNETSGLYELNLEIDNMNQVQSLDTEIDDILNKYNK